MIVSSIYPWLDVAKKHIGLREIKGDKHSMAIVDFWRKIKLNAISNDEVPWCAAFVGACLEDAGYKSTRSGLAKSYLNWGVKLAKPTMGCIIVFSRKGGGHVGFAVGKDRSGNLYVLGGNQSDAVNIKLFPTDNVVGYRWPDSNIVTEELAVLNTLADFATSVT